MKEGREPVRGRTPVIGLVGGIGAGKSTAAAAFAARGGRVIDADSLGHQALDDPEIRARIVARWGERTTLIRPDGRFDRRALAHIVFPEPAELRALEAIVFPFITQRIEEELARLESEGAAFIVLDAAVMLEAGWNRVCDHVVYVDAPRAIRVARLAARSGWSEADVAAREASQMPAEEKQRRADAVLMNDAGPEQLQTQVDRLLQLWQIGSG